MTEREVDFRMDAQALVKADHFQDIPDGNARRHVSAHDIAQPEEKALVRVLVSASSVVAGVTALYLGTTQVTHYSGDREALEV